MAEAEEQRRARSVDEWQGMMMQMFAAPQAELAPYVPRPTDVIISPFGKCGTTWLQQIFHTLRTRGDMDFDDISRVVPWIETSARLGIDLNGRQKAAPRGFKSHLGWDEVPKGARYIVSFRDPRDALVSMYKFMEGWFIEPGTVALEEFARGTFLDEERRYWRHLLSWWSQRHSPDVLLLAYEHMQTDPRLTVERVAAFCGISLDHELLSLALEHSSLTFMLEHKDRFDDLLMRRLSETVVGLPPGSDSAKVREGRVGSHKTVLSDAIVGELDAIWNAEVAPVTGCSTYQELAGQLA